jgi:hypothetical protein
MMLRAVKIWLLGSTGIGLVLLAWGWWALALPGGAPAMITYLDESTRRHQLWCAPAATACSTR